MKVLFLLVWLFLSSVVSGYGFLCYHCHQTSDECNNGEKINLQTTNCTSNECFTLQYETEMPGVKVLATFRGCYIEPQNEIMKTVVTEKHNVKKLNFNWCNYTLCNNAGRLDLNISFYLAIVYMLQVLLREY